MNHLFCFGLGYSAKELAKRLKTKGWFISGTSRSAVKLATLADMGFNPVHFDGKAKSAKVSDSLQFATHILVSISPTDGIDPVLKYHLSELASSHCKWIGYLSTIGVYGNWNGAWVDESDDTHPKSERSKDRLLAEEAWLEFGEKYNLPVHIFRLAGIYGPGRNLIKKLQEGKAKRLDKPGQFFNRIHVEDIAKVLVTSIVKPNPGTIYNVTDNEPAPPQDVVTFAAELLDMDPPPLIPFEEAQLTPMARSFYQENKRVRNTRITEELGVALGYPTYREGLKAIFDHYQGKNSD